MMRATARGELIGVFFSFVFLKREVRRNRREGNVPRHGRSQAREYQSNVVILSATLSRILVFAILSEVYTRALRRFIEDGDGQG